MDLLTVLLLVWKQTADTVKGERVGCEICTEVRSECCVCGLLSLFSTTPGAESPQRWHYSTATSSAWGRTYRTWATVRHIHSRYIVACVHINMLLFSGLIKYVQTCDCAKTEHSVITAECDVMSVLWVLLCSFFFYYSFVSYVSPVFIVLFTVLLVFIDLWMKRRYF